ncbi:MAG: arginine deiminase family protein [Bacteroidota bacterium]|nr:arginine deiminase family protein [Bacteroidota bacterium]
MSDKKIRLQVESEVGELEGVIVHTPGSEVENMTPGSAKRALYSDILNLKIAGQEYKEFKGVLQKVTKTFEVRELLEDILDNTNVRNHLIDKITDSCNAPAIKTYLLEKDPQVLSKVLIEGVPMEANSLTNYLDKNYFELDPLHNLFFTRDASSAILNSALINRMASPIRKRESLIMEAIFNYHPNFLTNTVTPENSRHFNEDIRMEGGDILVARKDVLLIGMGSRTSSQGIDYLAKKIESREQTRHIIVQQLPTSPESFIHLDMVFTLIDKDRCVIFEPLITKLNKYATIHLTVDNGKITSIKEEDNILYSLKKLGMDLKPIYCGGHLTHFQEREQWHSGANFFAFAPGKIIGYERNSHTIEALNKDGFEVLQALEVVNGKKHPKDYKKCVVTIQGSELSRGGGGARCMTMPIKRKSL